MNGRLYDVVPSLARIWTRVWSGWSKTLGRGFFCTESEDGRLQDLDWLSALSRVSPIAACGIEIGSGCGIVQVTDSTVA